MGFDSGAYSILRRYVYSIPPLSLECVMRHCPWTGKAASTVGLFLLASIMYVRGLCPTIYWFDSPEFVATTYTLGISHPAGSPTYSLFAKLVTFFPLGSIAFRVNAFSALVGASPSPGFFPFYTCFWLHHHPGRAGLLHWVEHYFA